MLLPFQSNPCTNILSGSTCGGKVISKQISYKISLIDKTPNDQLSQAEEDIISFVWMKYGHLDLRELIEKTHELPEWKKPPEGSRYDINIEDILNAEGISKKDIKEIIDCLNAEMYATKMFGE